MAVLTVFAISIAIIIYLAYRAAANQRNLEEKYQVEDLKKRIDELDNDNVNVGENATSGKIIVPDEVDTDDATRKSTQKEDCKEYDVGPKQEIEKTVIGSKNEESVFVNNEIERVEDDPIKEKETLMSVFFKDKKDEE